MIPHPHSLPIKKYWKLFKLDPLFVDGVVHHGDLKPVEEFVCHLYDIQQQPIIGNKKKSICFFPKAKKRIEMLSTKRDALELYAARANNQAEICQSFRIRTVSLPAETGALKRTVSTRTPSIYFSRAGDMLWNKVLSNQMLMLQEKLQINIYKCLSSSI